MTSINTDTSRKIFVFTAVYYLATTFGAVILGICLVSAIRPGGRTSLQSSLFIQNNENMSPKSASTAFASLILLVPGMQIFQLHFTICFSSLHQKNITYNYYGK